MNSNIGVKQTAASEAGEPVYPEAEFAAWLRGLRFTVEPAELDRARAGFERLAAMNRVNRTSSSPGAPRGTGVDA